MYDWHPLARNAHGVLPTLISLIAGHGRFSTRTGEARVVEGEATICGTEMEKPSGLESKSAGGSTCGAPDLVDIPNIEEFVRFIRSTRVPGI